MITAAWAVELGEVEALASGWDALAVACGAPVAGPAWALAWWRHVAPAGLGLRVVAVRDRDRLIGLLPMYVEATARSPVVTYRLLANSYASALTPLATPGHEFEVAQAAAELLVAADPQPDRVDLGPVPAFSPWAAALRERWPGPMRPVAFRTRFEAVSMVTIDGRTFDQWLGRRDPRVRSNARRRRRRFAALGGTYRYADAATLTADLRTYAD